jgi:hypothetical protein
MLKWLRVVTASILAASALIATPLEAGEPTKTSIPATQPPSEPPPAPVRTGKERLSSKASDEQRVDNCKAPQELRGAMVRPDTCEGTSQAILIN